MHTYRLANPSGPWLYPSKYTSDWTSGGLGLLMLWESNGNSQNEGIFKASVLPNIFIVQISLFPS